MDRSQTRLLVVLSALVVLVGGALYLQKGGEEEIDSEATEEIWQITPEQVTAISVSRAAGAVELVREGEIWSVRSPYSARADEDKVSEVLDALTSLRKGIPVEGADSHAADFGLGAPPEIHVVLTAGEAEHTLDIGTTAPTGYRTYVRTSAGKIVAAGGDPGRALQADAAAFRDRRVFRFDPAAVRVVTLSSPGGVLTARGQGKDWFLDGFGRADADKIDDMVVGLLDLRFESPLPDGLAIEPAVHKVVVETEGGETLSLTTGEPSPTDAGIRAVASDGRAGTLFPETVQQLGRGPTDLGVEHAFSLRLEIADSVEIKAGSLHVSAHRNGPAWQAEGLDDGDVYSALSELAKVPVEYRRDPPPPPEPVDATVVVREGDRAITVSLGAAGADGFRSAIDLGGGGPFRVPTAPFDAALSSLSR